MKKNDVIKKFATTANITQKDARELIDILGDIVMDGMMDEDGVTPFNGIRFYTVHKDARVGRNPSTGAAVDIPSKYYPKVKFSTKVSEFINN